MATWSSTDGAKGCGWTDENGIAATPSSPGQICKINYLDNGIGHADGMCVLAASQNECWALLNVAHQPSEYLCVSANRTQLEICASSSGTGKKETTGSSVMSTRAPAMCTLGFMLASHWVHA